jgi:molybdate transport system substrate-binding protein
VPAGRYGREVLQYLGLWEEVKTKLVLAKDVRQVLTYVGRREVDAGLVYATDAATTTAVKVVAAAPPGSHKPIVYRAAVVKKAAQQREARRFLDFLHSKEAGAIWQRYGFITE